ncbi:hypothetical protein HHK36_000204 [Tetracentron sinense]|uniref:Kinesin motor domain-containing protein n=1 Tax=Tetracentron sinense TaxID=13715 RepID=A0A834ZQN9_TETSI|nr:hypothetical protein HHK36_000204 [Tetracentron sinense]
MALSAANPSQIKANLGSDSHRKIRIIGKIRASTDEEIESSNANGVVKPWISVQKPNGESSDSVTISFGDQTTSRKESYKLDFCYEKNEDVSQIFSREIKPLLSGIFHGLNASIIAYGARGGGKTYTIQGSDEKPGLALLAMAEILSMSKEIGNLVTISCYEIYQDHIYDLLEHKEQEVLVLEDAVGRIQLKGLSQASSDSIYEHFPQKGINNVNRRSHNGLIVYVSCNERDSDTHIVGKMNFVDLAGYEDTKRKSNDGHHLVEGTRINKSIYTFQNVVYALNANESHVPYRESKLTRVLQDSLGGTSTTLMINCLNPSFCQDTIYTVSLASRSCLVVNSVCSDSTKKTKTGTTSMTFLSSPKTRRPQTLSTSIRKHGSSRLHLTEKKACGVPSAMKERKLFDEVNPIISSEQENSVSDASSAITPPALKEEISLSAPPKTIDSPTQNENDVFPPNEHSHPDISIGMIYGSKVNTSLEEDYKIDVEKKSSLINESGSPPLSARLRELSNSLKSLCYSTPLSIKMPQEVGNSCNNQVCTNIMEPKTPGVENRLRFNDNWEMTNIASPLETLNMRSSGIKKSLVREHLQFLNTASKEELKGLKGIGEKRANYILELRERSPEAFKDLNDLRDIGLSTKQINGMMKKVAGELFD